MQKDKYNNNRKKQKVERQKKTAKNQITKAKKKSVFTVNSHSSLILNSYILFQILPSENQL